MQDAQYFRNQAALWLEMARQMSNRQAGDNLRRSAARYFEKATELDHKVEPVGTPSHPDGNDKGAITMRIKEFRSPKEKRGYYRLLRYLLSNELEATYKEDQARPLPPRIADLLKTLLYPKRSETSSRRV
jgi:hypothetical protein